MIMPSEHLLDGDIWSKVFVRNQDVVSRKIAGELFLVPVRGRVAHMDSIFTLTSVAEFIWERLDGRSLLEIRDDVVSSFDAGPEQAGSDIQEFIMDLLEAGLIKPGGI